MAQLTSNSSFETKHTFKWNQIKRGEIYMCNLSGKTYGSEQNNGPGIIIQNNVGNNFSRTTIILMCTSREKKYISTHYKFNFIETDYIAMAEQIRTVDKTRLTQYLGRLSPEEMEEIDKILEISLALNDKESKIRRNLLDIRKGQVYLCDLSGNRGSEQGNKRPVIVVQNDVGNKFSGTTIVLSCTTKHKKFLPTHYNFRFKGVDNIVLGEQIRTVSKDRFIHYMGELTPKEIEEVNKILNISLDLNE